MNSDGPVVTVDRAAELLKCSRRRVFQLLADGTVRKAQSFGRQTLVITESIYEALQVDPVAIIALKPRGRKATAEFVGAQVEASRDTLRKQLKKSLKGNSP